jgi:hypothetical protein
MTENEIIFERVGWAKRSGPTILVREMVMVGTARRAPFATLEDSASQPPRQYRNEPVGVGLVVKHMR